MGRIRPRSMGWAWPGPKPNGLVTVHQHSNQPLDHLLQNVNYSRSACKCRQGLSKETTGQREVTWGGGGAIVAVEGLRWPAVLLLRWRDCGGRRSCSFFFLSLLCFFVLFCFFFFFFSVFSLHSSLSLFFFSSVLLLSFFFFFPFYSFFLSQFSSFLCSLVSLFFSLCSAPTCAPSLCLFFLFFPLVSPVFIGEKQGRERETGAATVLPPQTAQGVRPLHSSTTWQASGLCRCLF